MVQKVGNLSMRIHEALRKWKLKKSEAPFKDDVEEEIQLCQCRSSSMWWKSKQHALIGSKLLHKCAPCASTLPRPVKQSFITSGWVENFPRLSYTHLLSLESHVGTHVLLYNDFHVAADIGDLTCHLMPPRLGVKGKSPAAQSPGQTLHCCWNCWNFYQCLRVLEGGIEEMKMRYKKNIHVLFRALLGPAHHRNIMNIIEIKSNLYNPCWAGWHTLMLLSLLSMYICCTFGEHSSSWDYNYLPKPQLPLELHVSGPDDALEEYQMIALGNAMEDYTWKVHEDSIAHCTSKGG